MVAARRSWSPDFSRSRFRLKVRLQQETVGVLTPSLAFLTLRPPFELPDLADDVGQGAAVDELHGELVHAVLAAHPEDRHDFRVVQLRRGLGFGPEPAELLRVHGRRERQDF